MQFEEALLNLEKTGNLRHIPDERREDPVVDFSTNDYLGFGSITLNDIISNRPDILLSPMTSSASRLLAAVQNEYMDLEDFLGNLFKRPALLFNSGYHANTGIISAIASRSSLIIADRLVHASIIDGIILSRATLKRFTHNNLDELEKIISENYTKVPDILVIVESVYSMDGDGPDLENLIEIKRRYPNIKLYVDEAHAFGVNGPDGLGLTMATSDPSAFDIVIATFGKALASFGAFAITSEVIKNFLVNKSRSFIFSTSIPPIHAVWSRLMLQRMLDAKNERKLIKAHSQKLYDILSRHSVTPPAAVSHIQAMIIGDAVKCVELSKKLRENGIIVLPIRTPTVPAGTERLRFSISASLKPDDLIKLDHALS